MYCSCNSSSSYILEGFCNISYLACFLLSTYSLNPPSNHLFLSFFLLSEHFLHISSLLVLFLPILLLYFTFLLLFPTFCLITSCISFCCPPLLILLLCFCFSVHYFCVPYDLFHIIYSHCKVVRVHIGISIAPYFQYTFSSSLFLY